MSGADAGSGTTEFLPELAGLLLSEETVSGLLDLIVNLAVSAVEGVAGASISMLVHDGEQLETTNASSEMIREIDEAQYQDRAGPCVEAILTGEEVTVAIPVPAWTTFSDGAARAGVRTVWSLPLRVHQRTTGALNLYATAAASWEDPAAAAARGLARQASVVLANAAALMSSEATNQHLQEALQTPGPDRPGQRDPHGPPVHPRR